MNQTTAEEEAKSAERAVLAAALIDRDAFVRSRALLRTDDFFVPQHRFVWDAMLDIDQRGSTVDPITLEDALRTRGDWNSVGMLFTGQAAPGLGAHGWIGEVLTAAPTPENVHHYAEIVTRRSALRRLRLVTAEVAETADHDPSEAQRLLLESQKLLGEITRGRTKLGTDVVDLVGPKIDELQARADARKEGRARLVGISTGITDLDYRIGGFVPKTLNVIAARTSIGKTAYACQIALLAALNDGIPCLMFSLEMSPGELIERFLARRAKVDSANMRNGDIGHHEWTRLWAAGGEMSRRRGLFTISNACTLPQIWTEARAFRVEHRDERILIVVDYMQKVRTGERGRTREQEVAEVSAGLKEMAMELDCPFIVPAQLNRGPESGGESGQERDPKITDIRESGAIENDADVILLIVRKRSEAMGLCTIIIAKNRNAGALGSTEAEWHGAVYELRDPVNGQQGGN